MEIIVPFKERFRNILDIRGLKPVDLSKLTGLSEAQISRWLNGKYLPKQQKLYTLSKTLRCDPAWLMGYDVPMESQNELSEHFFMNDLKEIGVKRINECINELSITSEEISKILNVNEKLVCGWINGEIVPRPNELLNLAYIFKVNPAWLMGDNAPKKLTAEQRREVIKLFTHNPEAEEVNPQQFKDEVINMINEYEGLSEQDKNYIEQTLNFICKDKEN